MILCKVWVIFMPNVSFFTITQSEIQTRVWYRFLFTGVVTSPNYPGYYPNSLETTQTIQVKSGRVLRLKFTFFAVQVCDNIDTCSCDYVKITDGNENILMDKRCGFSSGTAPPSIRFLPPFIWTRNSKVNILFSTDSSMKSPGWSLNWDTVDPGTYL